MRRSTLEHLLRRKPFRPFRIAVSTQEMFDVKHPEAVYLAKRFMAVAKAPQEASDAEATEMVWIDYRHIVHCQSLPSREVPF